MRRGYRKQGVSSQLIVAAVKAARQAGAPALEAYPVDTELPESTSNIYTGIASTFERAGFKTVGGKVPHRPVMRYELRSALRATAVRSGAARANRDSARSTGTKRCS